MTTHLRERMLERDVTEEEVHATVMHPDSTEDTPEHSRKFMRQFGSRTLKVWVRWPPRGGIYIIKSTAWKGTSDG